MIAIALSIFNQKVSDGLLAGCLRALNDNGIDKNNIDVFRVPGAFELPPLIKKLSESSKHDCIIALGCIIKGETDHYHYISDAVTNGIMSVSIKSDSIVLFGVLTCQNIDLALKRSGKNYRKNKGYEVGLSAVEMMKG